MFHRCCVFTLFSFLSVNVAAQTPLNCPPTSNERPTVVANKGGIPSTTWTELQQTVTVVVDGLCAWVEKTKADPAGLRLYLAGHRLDKTAPTAVNLSQDYVKFVLKLDSATNRDEWIKILSTIRDTKDHVVNVSVGHPAHNQEVFVSSYFIVFGLFPRYTVWIVMGLVGLLVALGLLTARSSLLRVPGSLPPPARLAFSLGLVQMAAWFYLIVACYLYIWLLTGEYNTLTQGVLALAGISAATGLGATFVDAQKKQSSELQRSTLMSAETALRLRITEIERANPVSETLLDQELQGKKSDLAKVVADIATLPPQAAPSASRGFVKDILSDADGIRFHRFQVVVWTIVLAVVFVRLVHQEFAMPEFSAMLLGLMGLSSGTYVGFKFPETGK